MKRKLAFLTAMTLFFSAVKIPDNSALALTNAAENRINLENFTESYDTLLEAEKQYGSVIFSGNQVLLTFGVMIQQLGCEINIDKMEWEVYGTSDFSFSNNMLIKNNMMNSDGKVDYSSAHSYCLITANTPGRITVKGTETNSFNKDKSSFYWNLTVNSDGSFDEICTHDEPLKGDINIDGSFNITDIVMLQKWLLAVDDVTLPNWKAADLCEDGKLDVFDLCMMKHELISNTDNKPVLTKAELRDIILSKEEYTWSDFEQYQSEDIGSGVYILKYKVDFDGEDIEGNLYITGSDLEKKPEKIYIDVKRNDEEEKLDIYEFRQQLIDFIDSFNRQDMTMDDVLELSKKGKNLTWSDFENYQHGEDIGSGLAIYEFNIANYSDRFTLVVGYSDENSIQYARLKNSGYSIDITESSEDEIWSFIAMCNPPA